ncbi:hypothetical protein F1880_003733 [Penicillium rolfsii]|nr:hypothetical protein F1880_003733 [Penicillium rolfsii]
MKLSTLDQPLSGTRMPLSRFSYTEGALNSPARLIWTHINGDGNLFCEIEQYVKSDAHPSLILKVIHEGRALRTQERIDLDEHIGGANNGPKSSQEDRNVKPAFVVVVKLPCIAIKYLLNIMQMRRVQFKFYQDRDYYTVLSMLSGANCPLAEGSVPILHRPPSTVSWGSVATAKQTNNLPCETRAAVTPESNAPGPANYMGRKASGFETSSNAAQNYLSLQSLEPQCSLPAIPLEAGQTTSEKAPSRLSTGPIYHDQELNQMLPPKRDLPFTKLKSKMSRADTTSLKSSQQVVPESSYPEPDVLQRRESFMSEPQSQQLIQTQPYPEPMDLSQESARFQAILPNPALSTESQQPGPASSVAGSNKRARTDNGQINATIIQAPQSMRWSVPMSVEEQLSEYVKAPTKERSAFLEQWMCELIQDDNFVSLCEDVEGTWRRFAFGRKP